MTNKNRLTKMLCNNKKAIKYTLIVLLGLTITIGYVNIIIEVGEISYNKAIQLPVNTK